MQAIRPPFDLPWRFAGQFFGDRAYLPFPSPCLA